MNIGKLVRDYTLGKNGIVVGKGWIQPPDPHALYSRETSWEWEVLYDDGELMGADTSCLEVIKEEHHGR